jgi:O-antigen/teichoic acid export membrane protein
MFLRLLSAQWLGMGFVGLVSLGVSIAVARVLGPEQFGVYAIAVAGGAIIVILIDGGFSTLLQRERARATTSLAGLAKLLPGMANAHALLATLLLSICCVLLPAKYGLTPLTVVLLSGAIVLNQFALAILRGDGRLVRDAFWQAGARIFTAVAVALAFLLGADLPWHVFIAHFLGAALFACHLVHHQKCTARCRRLSG